MILPQREECVVRPTGDGSSTIYNPRLGSHFHSLHGAVGESLHVYIHGCGLPSLLARPVPDDSPIQILEIGLGTGLNLLLTAGWVAAVLAQRQAEVPLVSYTAFEPAPLPSHVLLSYYQSFRLPQPAPDREAVARVINAIDQQIPDLTLPGLTAELRFRSWQHGRNEWSAAQFDLVYYDPFGPGTAPEMWTAARIEELVWGLKPGGCLTSFSVSGATRRILSKLPVRVERPPGYGRKREMLRVFRLAD